MHIILQRCINWENDHSGYEVVLSGYDVIDCQPILIIENYANNWICHFTWILLFTNRSLYVTYVGKYQTIARCILQISLILIFKTHLIDFSPIFNQTHPPSLIHVYHTIPRFNFQNQVARSSLGNNYLLCPDCPVSQLQPNLIRSKSSGISVFKSSPWHIIEKVVKLPKTTLLVWTTRKWNF